MKKRILALALVLVTFVTVLTGCAYRYDKKDMSQYVTVADDYKGLFDFLTSITIKGDDFGPYDKDSTVRDDKVLEKIDATLAGKVTTDNDKKLKDDAVYALRQKIYYAFYCTTADGKIFETKNMDGAKLANFLSNPTYVNGTATEELALDSDLLKAIFAAIKDKKVTDFAYESESTGTLAAGNQVFVTYKYTYTDANGAAKSVTSEYMLLTVAETPAAGATKIEQLLVGKNIGKIEGTTENPLKFTDTELGECVVDSMTVHFRIKEGKGNAIEVPFTATADKEYTNAADTATSEKIKVKKDDVITYHVYPAYAYAVEELNATVIVKTIFGDSITTSSLDIFTENEKMKPLVEEISKLKTAYDQANSKVTSAGSSATDAQKKTRDEAKKALDDAVAALPEKLLATNEKAGELIVDAYKENVYETLETAYDAEIRKQLGAKIWGWIEENVKVDAENLPKAAVKEAKERILASHKNSYYTGQDSTQKKAYTEIYKTFDEYLAAVAYKEKDVDAEVDKAAKAEVMDIIRVYAVAEKLGDKVERVTNADISIYVDEIYPSLYYTFLLQGNYYPTVNDVIDLYGKTALRCSLTFDRIMDYFLATDADAEHTKYTNLKEIKFEK